MNVLAAWLKQKSQPPFSMAGEPGWGSKNYPFSWLFAEMERPWWQTT
jgi:hypothetical protein